MKKKRNKYINKKVLCVSMLIQACVASTAAQMSPKTKPRVLFASLLLLLILIKLPDYIQDNIL